MKDNNLQSRSTTWKYVTTRLWHTHHTQASLWHLRTCWKKLICGHFRPVSEVSNYVFICFYNNMSKSRWGISHVCSVCTFVCALHSYTDVVTFNLFMSQLVKGIYAANFVAFSVIYCYTWISSFYFCMSIFRAEAHQQWEVGHNGTQAFSCLVFTLADTIYSHKGL